GAAFLAQADNAISVAAEATQTRRAVLVDVLTMVLLRAGALEPGRRSSLRLFAIGNTVGSQVRFIGSTAGDRSVVEPPRVPVRSTSACRARLRAAERRGSSQHAELEHD